MKTWLVCYVVNYSESKRAFGNYIYQNYTLILTDLLMKLSKFCKDNYKTDRVAILNIMLADEK